MRIGIISTEYPPFAGGGIGSYGEAAAATLAELGHRVHVITNNARFGATEDRWTAARWDEGNLSVHRLPLFDEGFNLPDPAVVRDVEVRGRGRLVRHTIGDSSSYAAFLIADYVAKLHAEEGLDIVEVPDMLGLSFYIVRRRHAGRWREYPPVSVITHADSRESYGLAEDVWALGQVWLQNRMRHERYSMANADCLESPSVALTKRYVDRGEQLPELQAINPYYFSPPAATADPPPELGGAGPYLLLVGRIEPRKGTDIAVEAFAKLALRRPDLRLVLIGASDGWRVGEEFDQILDRYLDRDTRRRVLLLGQRPREQVLAAQRDAAVVVHPARWETFPNSILEAMSVGAACAVSDSGGQAEIIEDGQNGLVFRGSDADAMVAAVARLLDDAELIRRIRSAAPERIRSLTDKHTVTATKTALFERAMERNRKHTNQTATLDQVGAVDNVVVVVDATDCDHAAIVATLRGLAPVMEDGWRGFLMFNSCQAPPGIELPDKWTAASTVRATPWCGAQGGVVVVYLAAGVELDLPNADRPSGLRELVYLLRHSPEAAGTFGWLRCGKSATSPLRTDLGLHDLLLAGTALPLACAVRAEALADLNDFMGLPDFKSRLAVVLAIAAARGPGLLQHTGDVIGCWPGAVPILSRSIQSRALGALELRGFGIATCWLGAQGRPDK